MHDDGRPARGRAGEAMARLFLETRGYRVLHERLRVGRRELDLVAERGDLLIAVEVKWRRVATTAGDAGNGSGASDGSDERAARAWGAAQRGRAHEAVLGLMARVEHGAERPWRFDLVLIAEGPRGLTLTHHRGAWSPRDSFW